MKENSMISQYRNRLDKTLSSTDLTNVETLKYLVKDQIVNSPNDQPEEFIDRRVENRTKEVSNLLSMLRSASVDDERSKNGESSHRGWKVKQDTEDYRVMYREGPEGTPFHSLLVEGYIDGPVDVCLCISCEANLYPKWWPQITVPPFKITSSQCLKKIRIGEQICLVRMKCWPLSAREALIHFFQFDYFQDDLVIVLLNTISDLENIDVSTHGFTRDGIPDAQDVVRIDVVGGLAFQKVSENRSYFRTIANMDIKLDFVPPAFINFMSRQLVGSGFKLYKKQVASVSKGDEKDFGKALEDPLYTRVREALSSKELSTMASEPEDQNNETIVLLEEQQTREEEVETSPEIVNNENIPNSPSEDLLVQAKNSHGEIEEIQEENCEESQGLNEDTTESYNPSLSPSAKKFCTGNRKVVVIRPEVEQALRTLEKAISFIRECGTNENTDSLPVIATGESENPENDAAKENAAPETFQICTINSASSLPLKKDNPEIVTSNEARNSSASHNSRRGSNATNSSKIAPASSPDQDVSSPNETRVTAFYSSQNQASSAEKIIIKEDNLISSQANGHDENRTIRTGKIRKSRYCCFNSFA